MSTEGAQEGLRYLAGKKAGVRYRDLAKVLKDAGADEVSRNGSHRTWKHPAVGDLITIVDGSGDVLTVYIRSVRKYLEQITREA